MSNTITICFYGSSDHQLEVSLADFYKSDIDLIVDSIFKLNYSNIKIVTGGYGGIMNSIAEKFARKSKNAGKKIEIIGITCDAYDFENPDEQDYNRSNDYSIHNNVIIQSGNFAERVQAMIEMSDLFIVLPGKQGTLSELLFTCETYSYGKYFLNGKTTKVFTHEYWKPLLTSETYFRNFNTEILHFFSAKDLKNLIETHKADTISAINLPKRNSHPIDNWEARIKELTNDVCKVILGRVYDETKLLKRLYRDNQFPILGLDFGWFHTYNNKSKDGAYYSYSSEEYVEKTKEFFSNHNSIMLSDFEKDFDFDFIDGSVINSKSLKYYEDKNIPQRDSKKNDADFKKLVEFFNQKKYGQTLIWKGVGTPLNQIGNIYDKFEDADNLIFSVFLLLNHKIPRTTIERINQLLSDFLIEASVIKSGELFKQKDKDIINQATRAAIADIINRNYAHHIGSHVSHRATFEKILERLDITFQPSSTILYNSLATIAQLRNKLETYKDQRSEFIAGITNYPVYQSFWLYKDVLLPFIENTLLIDNIAANEGIRYYDEKNNEKLTIETAKKSISKLKIRLWIDKNLIGGEKVCEVTCTEQDKLTKVQDGFVEQFVCYKAGDDTYTSLCLPYYREVKNLTDNFYDDKGFNLAYSDIRISLPGTLGNHAIYSLLENYIRNTAKHAYKPEDHKDFVEIILKLSANKTKDSDDYLLTITDNISNGNKAEELQGKISSKLSKIRIEKNDNKGGMGIADMKICAALLKGLELTEENMRSAISCHNNNKHIAYSLTLLKPRELALIGNTDINENTSEGIYYYESVEAYLKDREKGYRFAIVDSGLIDNTLSFSRHWLPLRTIIFVDSLNEKNLSYKNGCIRTSKNVFEGNGSTVIERCWKTWLKGKLDYQFEKTLLGVYFEQKNNEKPTENWIGKEIKGKCFYDVDNGGQILKAGAPEFPTNENLHILFDRHGGLIKKATNIKFIKDNFYELIDKNNPDFNLLFTTDIQSEPILLHYEMIDAGMLNVLVIDERVAEVAHKHIDNYEQYDELLKHGFYKPKHNNTLHHCTIFDACWASHTYIATHLGTENNSFAPLSKEINPETEHYLKVTFAEDENRSKIVIKSETNIMGYKCNPSFQGVMIQDWKCSDLQQDIEPPFSFEINFDCLLIHRTKLDEILKQLKINFDQFAQMIDIPKIYVVTGGGTVDFVEDQQKITILPTNIIKDFIMGSRPAKICLSQILK